MCGIAGVLKKRQAAMAPIGAELLAMASCLQHRGMDSAGVAVFAAPAPTPRISVMLPDNASRPEPQTILALGNKRLSDLRPEHGGFSAAVQSAGEAEADLALIRALEEAMPGATVSAFGVFLTLEKVVGLIGGLRETVGLLLGTHGIAHLRLATESRIDPAHAQPFWGRPYPDIAVTHNGHITNYHKLRQKFEAKGFGFASRNDSEIIGIYLGEKLAAGASLRDALTAAGQELDGSYSFIAATSQGLGVTRDPFATKPLLYAETDDRVALASEPQALHRLLGEDVTVKEIRPREVRIWEKA